MRVSLFGLFLRCTSLMGPWPKLIKSILLVISFTLDFLFYDDYVIPVHTYYTCVLTLLSSVLDTCAHPGSPPGIYITTRLGSFTDSPGFSCPGSGACCGVVRSAATTILPLLSRLARGFSNYLVSALLYCSYTYIFCTLAFAPIRWCNIIVILDHLWW